jgi:peptidoglycan/LPS O-acetylase OafA/YrhL
MSDFRPDIQGLRAIAVAGVVLFHLWPDLVPGGYVGVDVFFVISGYLITGHLLRDAEERGGISLLRFYEKRIRRLLPAATTVLLAVSLAMPILPAARWAETALEIAASALYVENWRLAWLAVDYLGAENAPSPVQHYWSLSIEEQFYIIWPLLMMAGAWCAVRCRSQKRSAIFAILACVTLISFVASVLITNENPARAYFVTQARVWELGLGGLLALSTLPRFSAGFCEALRLFGLGAILFACFSLSAETAFPGSVALVPTIGSAAIIAAGSSAPRISLMRILALPPLQYTGDCSYSIYLWHWPLIVFAAVLAGGVLTIGQSLLVLILVLIVSGLSKTLIEDRFRHPSKTPSAKVILAGAAAITVCLIPVVGAQIAVTSTSPEATREASENYPGPAALLSDVPVPTVAQYMPPLVRAKKDVAKGFQTGCHLGTEARKLAPCLFGPEDSSFRIVLAGDSHAASWVPAFARIAAINGWRVETHTKSACPLLSAAIVLRKGRSREGRYDACYEWGSWLRRHLTETRPDIVVLSMAHGVRLYDSDSSLADVVSRTWSELEASGVKVLAIADTPKHDIDPTDCLAADKTCSTERSVAIRPDAQREAHAAMPRIPLIDMTDALCTATECPAVIGNVVVWRDRHHLTATYSRMLAPLLLARIVDALE